MESVCSTRCVSDLFVDVNCSGGVSARQLVERLEQYLIFLEERLRSIRSTLVLCAQNAKKEWISKMTRSKDGFTKEQAKELFYSFRQKKTEQPDGPSEPPKTDETDERFVQIMSYMEDTSKKLDRIETDIEFLKQQVADILKRL